MNTRIQSIRARADANGGLGVSKAAARAMAGRESGWWLAVDSLIADLAVAMDGEQREQSSEQRVRR